MSAINLKFLTGNENKVREVRAILGNEFNLIDCSIDLLEIQEVDTRKVICAKLEEASTNIAGDMFFVEDVSLNISAYGLGLPGPLIKWFILEKDCLSKITANVNSIGIRHAKAICTIGIAIKGKFYYFDGEIYGTIAEKPLGNSKFGWDNIFIPDGSEKTFGQMDLEEKNLYSMRKIAVEKMKDFILNNYCE